MKVFVTGATGVIGWELAKALAESGYEVVAYGRSIPAALHHPGVSWIKGDLLQKQKLLFSMEHCDQVYHLAAHAALHAIDDRVFFETNVQGTINVLEAAKAVGVSRVCFTGTCGILGPYEGRLLTEDDVQTGPFLTSYDLSKFMAEQKVMEYVMEGLDAVIVRVSRVFGPAQMRHSNPLTRMIKKMLPLPYMLIPGSPAAVNNYAYIKDVVSGHIHAMHYGLTGEKYILGGHNISYQNLFETIEAVTGRRRRLIRIPDYMLKLMIRLEGVRAAMAHKAPVCKLSDLPRLSASRPLSVAKSVSQIHYQVTPFETAIAETIAFLTNKSAANVQATSVHAL